MKYTVTSQNTKKIMAASLKKAMKTHPLSKITVSEIVKDCGFNRKTFYYHFEDIYALLKPNIKSAIDNAKRIEANNEGLPPSQCTPGTAVYEIFEMLESYLS